MLTLNFIPFPEISTQRLLLRAISPNDANEIIAIRSNKGTMKYIDRPLTVSTEDALQLIKKITDGTVANEAITWAITLQNNTSLLIGTIGFWKVDKEHRRAEIGYLLHSDHHQKGIMQEAIFAVLDFGFTNMQLHSVEANINPANEASKKLLIKNKFIQEAYFKENFFYNGKFLDSVIYSLLTPLQ